MPGVRHPRCRLSGPCRWSPRIPVGKRLAARSWNPDRCPLRGSDCGFPHPPVAARSHAPLAQKTEWPEPLSRATPFLYCHRLSRNRSHVAVINDAVAINVEPLVESGSRFKCPGQRERVENIDPSVMIEVLPSEQRLARFFRKGAGQDIDQQPKQHYAGRGGEPGPEPKPVEPTSHRVGQAPPRLLEHRLIQRLPD